MGIKRKMFLLLCLYMQQTYFLMKNKIILFITGCFALLLSSCLGSDEPGYELSMDCQITSFSLSSDSVKGLSSVVFTIDQVNGRIFNADSMPYGTEIEKVICSIKFASTVWNCQMIQEAVGDTIYWSSEDSIDFSKPVKIITTAIDQATTKTYIAQVNVHQMIPDSMTWELYGEGIAGAVLKNEKVLVLDHQNEEYYYMYTQPADASKGYQLFRSAVSDAKNWTELPLTGLPANEVVLSQITDYEGFVYAATAKGALYRSANGQDWALVENTPVIKALLGVVKEGNNRPSALSTITSENDKLVFASMNKEGTWNTGEEVAAGFPLSGFGNVNYNSMYRERLMLIGGKNMQNNLINGVWSTMDGRAWSSITDIEADYFSPREGAMVANYDDKLFLLGGIEAGDKALKDIYFSADGGVTWDLSDTLVVMPDNFAARGFASIHVDKDNFIYLFGGKEKTNSNELDQVWRGRIHRLGFKEE